jgi:hypothetical protein
MGLLQERVQSGGSQEPQASEGESSGLLARRLRGNDDGQAFGGAADIPQYQADDKEIASNGTRQKKFMPKRTRPARQEPEPEQDKEFGEVFETSLHEDSEQFQSEIDEAEAMRQVRESTSAARKSRAAKILLTLMIAMSVYLAWLIYGAIVTDYDYGADGKVAAQRMSVAEIAAAEEFKLLQSYYLRARDLYEEALTLDYRLACYPDEALLIAADYEAMLETTAKLAIDIGAAKFGASYGQFQKQILSWVQTDIAVYLQNISAAITQNDSEKANRAIISRDVMYNDFMLLSQNIAVFGRNTKGTSLGDIYEWSPEKFVREELEGLQ